MTYSHLARGYDAFTEDVDYTAWADYMEKLFKLGGRKVGTVVELACGTGTLAAELCRRGYDVTATDMSSEMLSAALNKCLDMDERRPLFLCQDMRRLDLFGTYDAAICCLDSINYLDGPAQLEEMLLRLKNFIEPGGLFIFDINSDSKFKHIAGRSFVAESDDVYCVWQVGFEPETRRCGYYMDIFTLLENGLWQRDSEEHTEFAFSPEEIEAALLKCGFEQVRRFGERSLNPPVDTDNRLFFVAKRSEYR